MLHNPGKSQTLWGARSATTNVNTAPAIVHGRNCSTASQVILTAVGDAARRQRTTISTPVTATLRIAAATQSSKYSRGSAAGSGATTVWTAAAAIATSPENAAVAERYPRKDSLRATCSRISES